MSHLLQALVLLYGCNVMQETMLCTEILTAYNKAQSIILKIKARNKNTAILLIGICNLPLSKHIYYNNSMGLCNREKFQIHSLELVAQTLWTWALPSSLGFTLGAAKLATKKQPAELICKNKRECIIKEKVNKMQQM